MSSLDVARCLEDVFTICLFNAALLDHWGLEHKIESQTLKFKWKLSLVDDIQFLFFHSLAFISKGTKTFIYYTIWFLSDFMWCRVMMIIKLKTCDDQKKTLRNIYNCTWDVNIEFKEHFTNDILVIEEKLLVTVTIQKTQQTFWSSHEKSKKKCFFCVSKLQTFFWYYTMKWKKKLFCLRKTTTSRLTRDFRLLNK